MISTDGYQIVSSTQGESAYLDIELRDGGTCYGNSGFGIWEHQVCAAGIPRIDIDYSYGVPAWITELIERQDKPPVYHPPTCVIGCGPDLPPIEQPIPEPATAALCMAALAIVGLRLMLRRGAR